MSAAAETFEQLIRHNTAAELVPFLLALDKKDVLPVRTRARSLSSELDKHEQQPNGQLRRPMQPRQSLMLFLAGLATYSQKEALSGWFSNGHHLSHNVGQLTEQADQLHIWTILRHARPSWLTTWFLRNHRNNPWTNPDFDTLQALMAEGLLEDVPELLAYATAQSLYLLGSDVDKARTLAEQRTKGRKTDHLHTIEWNNLSARWSALAAGEPLPPTWDLLLAELRGNDALLHRGLPLLFAHDTAVDSTSTYDRTIKPFRSIAWLDVLPELARSGHLDRAELLTNCLLALRRDFRRPLLTWFKELFLSLQPTPDERLARQADLTELLAHPLAQVVNFALDQLKDLWLLPGFEVATLLLYIDNLLTRPDLKTGLKSLFASFDRLLKASPALAPTLAPRYATALAHPDAGVQERAAKSLTALLGAKKPLLDAAATADIVVTLQELGELLSTPARALLVPWLAAAPAPSVAQEAYAPRAGFVPDISEATAIAPVADWHELLFLTGQALKPDQPAEQERWLDGLLRLRGQYPADYVAQLRPYLLQAFPWLLKGKTEAETANILRKMDYGRRAGQRDFLQAMLVGWHGGFAQPQVVRTRLDAQHQLYPDPLLGLARQRLLAAEARLAPGAGPLPLLSTPTHQPFWVAPTALVAKLLAYETAGQEPDPADLTLALSRLAWNAPADAATARQQLASLQNPGLRELLAWLLAPSDATPPLPPLKPTDESLLKKATSRFTQWVSGETPAPPTLAEALPWLWAVAARTRAPQVSWPELATLADYPGLAEPWQPGWYMDVKTHTINQSYNKEQPEYIYQTHELTVPTAEPAAPPSPLLLYSLHARLPQKDHSYIWPLLEDPNFLLSLVPNNPAPLHWHLLRSAFSTSEGYSEEQALLTKQLHASLADGPVYEEPATVLLAVGLLYSKPAARALAWEVLLAAADTGRLVPVALGTALGRLLAGTYAPVLRLADALPAARGISPTTDDALRQLLEALLPELPAEPLRNTAKLLAAYADLRPGAGKPMPAVVQERLQTWQSVGSLKKAVTTLLA
ncbi:hypothetical protein D0N36_10170 [Hymenobacter lapidiphilus]|uniref:DUF6493 family protein n=1 Tax=Hymenobacter sp. CCM 8763 TaxID=2303334 RepID=UPI000E350000|nr:DUF6493 family protein [Hymenobacter sp. CCM 8763]RFP65218.1 hypothetical protein D0N36_10170 [Hymenobacter sp. CCM 8763]